MGHKKLLKLRNFFLRQPQEILGFYTITQQT
jgi:hypothetical protein